jgi:outer membrane translocation and assembly module TamA
MNLIATWMRHRSAGLLLVLILSLFSAANAQQASSRREQIELLRKAKQARLWPERTSGIAKQLNKLTERGLLEGARSGKGTNGPQIVLGGMRSGNGTTFGVGYRRIDLWRERIAFRATARATFQKAYMFDLEIEFPRLRTDRAELTFYGKFENSPLMDFYGLGPKTARGGRSSYRLEDTGLDLEGRYRIWNNLYGGVTGGVYLPNTGPGQRSGSPSIEEKYDDSTAPGVTSQPSFLRAGGFLQYDWRDNPEGPTEGGNYYSRYQRYWDQDLGQHTFHRLESAAEQYFPYFNKNRVIALRLAAVMTYANDGQSVPFYLMPTLGGNEYLRGFRRYRFYDQSSILFSAEHRWHIFAGSYAALFYEAGKVAAKASQLNFHNLEHAAGIGFRFTIRHTVVMRIDHAFSREGYRFIWTFSNMW